MTKNGENEVKLKKNGDKYILEVRLRKNGENGENGENEVLKARLRKNMLGTLENGKLKADLIQTLKIKSPYVT